MLLMGSFFFQIELDNSSTGYFQDEEDSIVHWDKKQVYLSIVY